MATEFEVSESPSSVIVVLTVCAFFPDHVVSFGAGLQDRVWLRSEHFLPGSSVVPGYILATNQGSEITPGTAIPPLK